MAFLGMQNCLHDQVVWDGVYFIASLGDAVLSSDAKLCGLGRRYFMASSGDAARMPGCVA